MKMGDENTFLTKASNWFQAQKKGMKIGMVSTTALVVCGAIAIVVAVNVKDGAPKIETLPSSEIVSVNASSAEPQSSRELDQAVLSSEEAGETVSTGAEVSNTALSSTPTVSTVVAGASTSSESTSSQAASSQAQTETPVISVDFSKVLAANKDVKGQIYLPGTKLNAWVCQGTDNSFYLNHDVYKKKNGWAVPMMDYRATLTKDARSTNIVLYGHSNDKTGEHFSAIKSYNKDGLEFYKQHPTIQFNTIYGDGNYKIIGMFLENVNVKGKSFGYHNFINAQSEEDFNKFVNEVKGRSFLTMPVDTQYGDQLITLSTCLSTSSKNSRYVLVARKVRPGESAAVEVDKATVNANMIPPSGPLN